MKKLFSILSLCALAFVASAQNYRFQSFLNVRSLGTGTNGIGVTNLSAVVTNAGMILNTNVYFTNNAGSILRGAAYTNAGSQYALFHDVSLWTDREGRLPITFGPYPQFANPVANTTNYPLSAVTLSVALSSPYGTNGLIGIALCPIWDNTGSVAPNTPTSLVDDYVLTIPVGSGYTTVATNLPIWKWPGAYGLRVRYITNNFALAGEAAITNATFIHRLGIGGYVP